MVSQGCRDRGLQTGRLRTTEIYFLTVLEAISLQSRCGQGWFLLRKASLLAPGGPGRPRHPLMDSRLTAISASVSQCTLPVSLGLCLLFLQGHKSRWIKGHLLQYDLILTNYAFNDTISKQGLGTQFNLELPVPSTLVTSFYSMGYQGQGSGVLSHVQIAGVHCL